MAVTRVRGSWGLRHSTSEERPGRPSPSPSQRKSGPMCGSSVCSSCPGREASRPAGEPAVKDYYSFTIFSRIHLCKDITRSIDRRSGRAICSGQWNGRGGGRPVKWEKWCAPALCMFPCFPSSPAPLHGSVCPGQGCSPGLECRVWGRHDPHLQL